MSSIPIPPNTKSSSSTSYTSATVEMNMSSSTSEKKRKRLKQKRKQLSMKEKQEILVQLSIQKGNKSYLTQNEIATKFGVGNSTITGIKQNAATINSATVSEGSRKRIRESAFAEMESAMSTWFAQVRSKNLYITGPMIQAKSLEFAGVFVEMGMIPFYRKLYKI